MLKCCGLEEFPIIASRAEAILVEAEMVYQVLWEKQQTHLLAPKILPERMPAVKRTAPRPLLLRSAGDLAMTETDSVEIQEDRREKEEEKQKARLVPQGQS